MSILFFLSIFSFAAGIRLNRWAAIDSINCEQQGRWVLNEDQSTDCMDSTCSALPKFDASEFCKEELHCSSMLMVGDSTMHQKFSLLLSMTDTQKSRNKKSHKHKFFYEDPTHEVEINRQIMDAPDYHQNCSFSSHPICQASCPEKVQLTYIRHDHLNGLKYGHDKTSQCDNWKDHMKDHPHLMLGTGTHVGDHPDLMNNVGNIWESRAQDLFEFLQEKHPKGIVWTPAYYGLSAWNKACPQKELWKERPVRQDEIDTSKFDGSWLAISKMNKVYKDMIKKFLPDVLILDHEEAMSMRSDCRKDFIHQTTTSKASPIHWQIRNLQYLMHSKQN